MQKNGIPNVFSVDVEDWYQGLEFDMDDWRPFSPRIDTGLDVLLDLLEQAGARGTFFVLGWQAERTPSMVPRLVSRGHEIATHGYSHRFVYQMTPEDFRRELRRSIDVLEQQSGQKVIGHRAPYFSITGDSLWALDILAEQGIRYDSSIFPTLNYRYGIPGANRYPGWIRTPSGAWLYEIPLSTVRVPASSARSGINLPLGGGGYFRLYPYAVTRGLAQHLRQREHKGLIFYVHPWEYDPEHPHVKMPRRIPEITHYFNLGSTASKTRRLLADFAFTTMKSAFADVLEHPPAS